MLAIFLVSFAQIFLVAFNSRNTAQGRYKSAFIVSLLITIFQVLQLKLLVTHHFEIGVIVSTGLGGAFGVVGGTYSHKHFMRKKPPETW